MRDAGVSKVCLVSGFLRNDVCAAMVSGVSKSLNAQGVTYQRMPIVDRSIEWRVGDSGVLTVTLSEEDTGCRIHIESQDSGDDNVRSARLAGVAAHLCTMLNIKHVYWNDQDVPLPAHGFLDAVLGQAANPGVASRVYPRKVPHKVPIRPAAQEQVRLPRQSSETWLTRSLRTRLNKRLDDDEIATIGLKEARSQSAPVRLSAWAMSLTTAVVAAPLALPVLVHNALRGEDLRLACHSMGLMGLYAALAHSGALPSLPGLL